MDYKNLWETLKTELKKQVSINQSHEQSELSWGITKCIQILKYMSEFEKSQPQSNNDYDNIWRELKEKLTWDMISPEPNEKDSMMGAILSEGKCQETLALMSKLESQALKL